MVTSPLVIAPRARMRVRRNSWCRHDPSPVLLVHSGGHRGGYSQGGFELLIATRSLASTPPRCRFAANAVPMLLAASYWLATKTAARSPTHQRAFYGLCTRSIFPCSSQSPGTWVCTSHKPLCCNETHHQDQLSHEQSRWSEGLHAGQLVLSRARQFDPDNVQRNGCAAIIQFQLYVMISRIYRSGVPGGRELKPARIIDILFSLRGFLWKNLVCPGSLLRCPSLVGPSLKTLVLAVENLIGPGLKISGLALCWTVWPADIKGGR
jgi:hypothetical protein